MEKTDRIPDLIKQIYEIVKELETLWPNRRFTPDGHMIGSIGEVLAAHYYGLNLLSSSSKDHDAESKEDGRKIQIKVTQKSRVALRGKPEHLLVLSILKDGTSKEVYNGPGELVWEIPEKCRQMGKDLSLS